MAWSLCLLLVVFFISDLTLFFHSTKIIDLDQISFSQLHTSLSKLKDTTQTEIPTLASNTWRNVLAMYCLEAVAEELPNTNEIKKSIAALINQEGFTAVNSHNRLVNQIERFLIRIAEIGLADEAPTPLGLSKNQYSVVNTFPSNPSMAPLL